MYVKAILRSSFIYRMSFAVTNCTLLNTVINMEEMNIDVEV